MRAFLKVKLALGLGTLVIATAGCGGSSSGTGPSGGEPQAGGEITVLRTSDIDSWDPNMTMLVETFRTLPMVMEGLVRPGTGDQPIQPGLATSWKLDYETKTLTFKLRPDLSFSDGSPLTAADVAFSVDLWRQGMAMGSLYSAIDRAEAINDRTVVLHMNRPSTFTLSWLANGNAIVVPEDFAGQSREDFFADPIGAGPFVIAEHRPGQTLVLERNERYYDPERPYLDRLTYEIVADPNQQLLRLQSGQADVIEGIPLDVSAQVPEDQQVRLHPSATIFNIQANFQRAPGDDVHFRRAVSLAIDREEFIEAVFGGQAEIPGGFLPPKVESSVGCSCEYEYDPAAAERELAKSSYQPGDELELIVDANDVFATRAGDTVEAMLEDVGIEVSVEEQEIQVKIDNHVKGNFDLTTVALSSVSPTVGDIFSLVVASEDFYSKQSIEVVKEAFADLDVARTDEDKEDAVRAVENWNHERLVVIPVAYPDLVYGISPRVFGLDLTSFGHYDASSLWVG